MSFKRFEEIPVWQKARQFCKDIFQLTLKEGFRTSYKLRDQILASSGSIMDNIAEGYERDGNKELCQFLFIAKGSCGEARSQLYRALIMDSFLKKNLNSTF
jgi:four helix bundle protein